MAQIGRPAQPRRSISSSDEVSYLNPKEYIIGGTTVTGTQQLDKDILVQISKLTPGERIEVPGEATANAVKFLWAQGLFDDVELHITRTTEDSIFFNIAVTERPRLARIELKGMKKGETTDIKEKLADRKGKVVNEGLLSTTVPFPTAKLRLVPL